jgi:hypothetical protein
MVATDWDGVSELAQLAIVLFQSSSKQTGFGSRPSLADGRIETRERSGPPTIPLRRGVRRPQPSDVSARARRHGRRPLRGVLSLTLVLIAFFVIEGIASIMFALDHKRELSGRWGWMLASGIIDLILATIILAGLPGTAVWALWLLVGINMVFGGSALIAMALYAREIDPRSAAPAR